MQKKILSYNNPAEKEILQTVSTDVDSMVEALTIAKDLRDSLDPSRGVGLAAPQIGYNKRVILVSLSDRPSFIMVNPVIVEAVGKMKQKEGCLSNPGVFVEMKRKSRLVVNFLDEEMNPQTVTTIGFDSAIIMHEVDHLNGKTIFDGAADEKANDYM